MVMIIALNLIIINYQLGNQPQKVIINRTVTGKHKIDFILDQVMMVYNCKYLLHLQVFLFQQLFQENVLIIL